MFQPSTELRRISSGYFASESMKQDLLLVKKKGIKAFMAFERHKFNRIPSNTPQTGFSVHKRRRL